MNIYEFLLGLAEYALIAFVFYLMYTRMTDEHF